MIRMTKIEAINYLKGAKAGTARCPLCKQIAARLITRYPNGVDEDLLYFADELRWKYTGTEKHI